MKRATQINGRTNGTRTATTRVAVYTRKSVSEGLDQEFNSLDAQREAVEAYVLSQRGEGWVSLPEEYSDAGFTGANVDRPAFQRLLDDVAAGRIDVIAVYKIDRLSRSLADFARLMELFERHGVAFVSVTQQFNSASSMGRLTLNILMSFAEFERQTIAERTRDKIGASRRRGMWTGGRPVLGFDIIEKKLIVNAVEAEQVREVFRLYVELGSMLPVVEELRVRGDRTKTWTNGKGALVQGVLFTKSSLYNLLTNPIYCGRIRAGDEIVDAAHEAIVTPETWQAVQDLLRSNHVGGESRAGRTSQSGALLAGIARCSCGATLSCTYTSRGSKRYGYYQCARMQREGAGSCPGSRVAAGEFESFVFEQIRSIGRDPGVLATTLEADRRDRETRKPELIAEVRRLTAERTRLETERMNVVDAVGEGGSGRNVLLQRLDDLDGALSEADQRASAARAELQALELGAVDPEELRVALADLEMIWSELFPRERARVIALLLETVVFDATRGEVELTFRAGGPRALRSRTTEVVA